jgi:hypothetical protein
MQVFRNNNNVLTPIQRDSFKLEADIHSLVEPNLEMLFQLEYVTSEFAVGDFRLDTLAFDNDANAFVIIEYKKGNSYSVVDQGYSYLSVMVNNKADFILEYNEKTGKQLKRDDVDWTASRVIFVAPSFNAYQKNSVNFRNVPFELWEIRKFDEGIIVLEQCLPTSSESMDKIAKSASTPLIDSVSAQVHVPTESDHVGVLDEATLKIWRALRERIVETPDSTLFVSKGYISWRRDTTAVCFIQFRQRELKIEILRGNKKPTGELSRGFFDIDDPKKMTRDKSWTWKNGHTGHVYVIHVDQLGDLDYVMFLLEQKYRSLE